MKCLLLISLFLVFPRQGSAQLQSPLKKLDSIAQKVIIYLKNKQPDSVYALTGKVFREKITPENFNSIITTKIYPLANFENVKYLSSTRTINKYRVEGTPTLQMLIGLDVDDKIETLLIQEYVPD